MKAAILTSFLLACLSVANVFAQDTDKKVLTNIEQTETGTIKEQIYLNDESSQAERKITYYYDLDDNLFQKVDSKWDSHAGWVPAQKYEYTYNTFGKVASVTFTKWDNKREQWAESKSKQTAHIYNEQGELMAIK